MHSIPQYIKDVKQPMKRLNSVDGQKWEFLFDTQSCYKPNDHENLTEESFPDELGWESIRVPGNIAMQGWDIDENRTYETEKYKNEYYYRTQVDIPEDYANKKVLLRFEAVYGGARVWVNNHFVREHFGSFTTWECDISDYVKPGEMADVIVGIVERFDDPSAGSSYAHMNIAGINRDVHLMAIDPNHIGSVHTLTKLNDLFTTAQVTISIEATLEDMQDGLIKCVLKDGEHVVGECSRRIVKTGNYTLDIEVESPKLWDAEHPNLYTLQTELIVGNVLTQLVMQKVGIREIYYKGMKGTDPRKVYVNGKEVKLRGTCRHDMTADRGRSTTWQEDYEEVKIYKEMNMNYVRTSHYPPSKAFLEACDELGMYVEEEAAVAFQTCNLTELPGLACDEWFVNQFREMVERDKSHPCVLIWSLGNESWWEHVGPKVEQMYEYIMVTDQTRPHKWSYTELMPQDKQYISDMWSSHYKHNGWVTDKQIPVIHDEYGHVACYNIEELSRDLGVRNWWGENVKLLWDEIYETEGMLGGALWGGIDEVFYIPTGVKARYQNHSDGTATGYGEWGSVMDVHRRMKPEAWLTKKAYSPIRIDEKNVCIKDGYKLEIPIENRFMHTCLSEVELIWSVGDMTGKVILPEIKERQLGVLHIADKRWYGHEQLLLSFYSQTGIMIDSYCIPLVAHPRKTIPAMTVTPTLTEVDGLIHIEGAFFKLILDAQTGKIQSGSYKDQLLLTGGPNLHVGGKILGDWSLDIKSGIQIETNSSHVKISTTGSYGELAVKLVLEISGNGVMRAHYEILGEIDEKRLHEVGISFEVNAVIKAVSWEREGLWSVYPKDHIGRLTGTAYRVRKEAHEYRDQYGVKPLWSWKDDMANYYLYEDSSTHPNQYRVTNDFKTMREYILEYDVIFEDGSAKIHVVSQAEHAVRIAWEHENKATLIINNDWSYTDHYLGNYEKKPATLKSGDTNYVTIQLLG